MNKELILSEFGRVAEARGCELKHSPKSLATTIVVEAAKLLENFQRMSEIESEIIDDDAACLKDISADVADIYIYLTVLCHKLDMDPWVLVKDKLLVNREKHVERCFAAASSVTSRSAANTAIQDRDLSANIDWANIAERIASSRLVVSEGAAKLKKKAGSP
ncbi:hypothetical protein [Teredinibacter haidensis]|uniref:hypothetical protein n=1 Tax=Teredinibacter haidensis TaxID=2731755 RepID=UPI000948BBA9|nr:hypothetical protein [Teredinibacter haidensis]